MKEYKIMWKFSFILSGRKCTSKKIIPNEEELKDIVYQSGMGEYGYLIAEPIVDKNILRVGYYIKYEYSGSKHKHIRRIAYVDMTTLDEDRTWLRRDRNIDIII